VRLSVSPQAQEDVDSYAAFVGQDDPAVGVRFFAAVNETFVSLCRHPLKGRRREFRNPLFAGMRSVSVTGFRNHLIFYQPSWDRVLIVRIIHGARNLGPIFGPTLRRRRR
jgi:toxin ParE1/3/4